MKPGILATLATHFLMLSVLAFGGANAVIPEIQRDAVAVSHWMTDRQFADLYALYESGQINAEQFFSRRRALAERLERVNRNDAMREREKPDEPSAPDPPDKKDEKHPDQPGAHPPGQR